MLRHGVLAHLDVAGDCETLLCHFAAGDVTLPVLAVSSGPHLVVAKTKSTNSSIPSVHSSCHVARSDHTAPPNDAHDQEGHSFPTTRGRGP